MDNQLCFVRFNRCIKYQGNRTKILSIIIEMSLSDWRNTILFWQNVLQYILEMERHLHAYSVDYSIVWWSFICNYTVWNIPLYGHPSSPDIQYETPLYGHPSSPPIQYRTVPYMVIPHLHTYSMKLPYMVILYFHPYSIEQSLIWSSLTSKHIVWNCLIW